MKFIRPLFFTLITAGLIVFVPALWAASSEPDLLDAEQAFRFSARLKGNKTIEISYQIAPGYYMYRDKFQFLTESAQVKLGTAKIPKGRVKHDPLFGRVETYRNRLRIQIPVESPVPPAFSLTVVSQGCADLGVCYPPLRSRVTLGESTPPAPAKSLSSLFKKSP